MTNALHGHRFTLEPYLRSALLPSRVAPSHRLRVPFVDPQRGEIALTGRLGPSPTGDELLVAIHGLGGHTGSYYMHRAVSAAERAGIGCLRMNMRGADRGGADVYHGGLAEDVGTLLSAPELAGAKRIYLLGYSLGGHLALAYAASGRVDPRVAAVASVCAPLDFDAGARAIDAPSGFVYRHHLLRGLKEVYRAAHARRPLSLPPERVDAIGGLREWDRLVVAPRYGFESAEHYYATVSVGPRLAAIDVPTLMVVAEHDPMVKLHTLRSSLANAGKVELALTPYGGHVGFPEGLDLGLGASGTIEDQLLGWLRRRGGARPRA